MKDEGSIKPVHWVVFIFLAVVWGSSFILIEKGLGYFSAVEVACLRISLSMIAFVPFMPRALKKIRRIHLKGIIGMGLLGNLIPAFLFAHAQTEIDSSVAGILNALTPIFTMVLGALLFRQSLMAMKVAGVILGFAGAAIIVWKGVTTGDVGYAMEILVIVATLSYGLSSNIIKAWLTNISALDAGAIAFLIIGPLTLLYLITLTEFTEKILAAEALLPFMSILLLALMGTVLASVLYIKLLQDTNAVFGTSVTYLIPFVAILWGWLDGDALGLKHIAGLFLILSGVYLISKKRKAKKT